MWAGVFGKEHLCVRPYERGQLYQGDAAADFLHHILGIEPTDEFLYSPSQVNSRLHRVVLEYKRLVNLLGLPIAETRKMADPLRELSAAMLQQGRKDYSVFSPAQRLELIAQYAEENAAISQQLSGAGRTAGCFTMLCRIPMKTGCRTMNCGRKMHGRLMHILRHITRQCWRFY
jgi:hypothetical protein